MGQNQIITTTYVDDITGAEYDEATGETFAFAFDGTNYEIDLSEKNAAAFRKVMEKYTSAARVAARKANGASGRQDLAQVREWAKSNNMEVSNRGRVSTAILTAYDRANNEG